MSREDVIIIGAGVVGLTLAHGLKKVRSLRLLRLLLFDCGQVTHHESRRGFRSRFSSEMKAFHQEDKAGPLPSTGPCLT